jgi:hypothetical protein
VLARIGKQRKNLFGRRVDDSLDAYAVSVHDLQATESINQMG